MAIDQDIAQRVDAYRGNPQALQQRYAANQELLDLLALQRLKSEKDDAMRKVQLEMEQDPQTIKQQKERQLLEMTKQDLTNQTAGIMQNAQKKQQKNMQRVAKQGAPSPQQMQQVQSGLGVLAQRQQGQAPMRMAAGGIVAFQEGKGVKLAHEIATEGEPNTWIATQRKLIEELETRAKDPLISRAERDRLRRAASDISSNISVVQMGQGVVRGIAAPFENMYDYYYSPQGEFQEAGHGGVPIDTEAGHGGVPGEYDLQDRSASNRRNQFNTPGVPKPPRTTDETSLGGAGSQGLAAMLQENQLTAPSIDMTGINANQAGKGILTGAGINAQNPNAARTDARDDAATFLGRDEKRDTMNDHLEQLKAMDVSQQDPKKLWDQEISAFLRGTAGGGSFGQTMAGGSQGMADERSAQEKSSRDRLLSRLNIEKSAMDMDMDIAKSAQSSGDSAYAQAMQNQRTIASILSQTRGQEVELAMKNAQLEFDANKGNVQNILKGLELEYTDALRRGIAEGDRAMRAGEILGRLQVDRAEFFEKALDNDSTYSNAQIAASREPNEGNAALVKSAYDAVQIRVTQMYEAAGLLNTEAALMEIIGGRGGAMPPTAASFNLSDEGRAALARNQ